MAIKKIKKNQGSDKGGKGKMHQLFGEQMTEIIDELNEVLTA